MPTKQPKLALSLLMWQSRVVLHKKEKYNRRTV